MDYSKYLLVELAKWEDVSRDILRRCLFPQISDVAMSSSSTGTTYKLAVAFAQIVIWRVCFSHLVNTGGGRLEMIPLSDLNFDLFGALLAQPKCLVLTYRDIDKTLNFILL